MASISTYKGATGDTLRSIQFMGSDKKRRSIRLGTLPAKDVGDIAERIGLLEVYRKNSRAPDPETIRWLGNIDDGILDKLAAGGLCEPRGDAAKPKGLTLGAYLENYLGQRQALVAAGQLNGDTLRKERQTRDSLIDKFSPGKLLASFTCGDAEDFRNHLLTSGSRSVKRCGTEIVIFKRRPLAEATTRKQCSIASKFFRTAVRRELITRNPFDTDAVPKSNVATSRHAYIKAADAKAVLEKLPGTQWQLLFSLLRWGGLRVGEPRLLTWADVLWDENALIVHSPKTQRYEGHEMRRIPLFGEILGLLEKRYDEAAEGDQHVLPFLQGITDASLRKTMKRAIVAAGLTVWPRLFHNLRGTRQNELLEENYTRPTVCAWIGNSTDVAAKHYEKPSDRDWQRATAPLIAPPTENATESR